MKFYQMAVHKLVRPSRSYQKFHGKLKKKVKNHLNLAKIVLEQYVKKKPKGKNILHETIDYINCTPTTPAPWHKYQGTQYKFDQDYSTREAQRRHFSHATKSRIFKNLNLRKKADLNFRGKFLKNHFRHLKLYSNPPS